MEINSNSQMSLLNRISQTVIDDIDDFSIEEESNKIKVKPDSLENILNHWNIPMSRSAVVNNTNEISNENLYTIIDRNLDIIEDGAKKPINVKPAMFENIIGKSFDVQPSKIVDNVFSNEKSTGSDLDEGFITVDDDINELMSQLDGYKDTFQNGCSGIQARRNRVQRRRCRP